MSVHFACRSPSSMSSLSFSHWSILVPALKSLLSVIAASFDSPSLSIS